MSEEDSLPKGIGDSPLCGRALSLFFPRPKRTRCRKALVTNSATATQSSAWYMSEEDSLPKGIGDYVILMLMFIKCARSEEDSLPKGIGDVLTSPDTHDVRVVRRGLVAERHW